MDSRRAYPVRSSVQAEPWAIVYSAREIIYLGPATNANPSEKGRIRNLDVQQELMVEVRAIQGAVDSSWPSEHCFFEDSNHKRLLI
jgi:hypothetical protein